MQAGLWEDFLGLYLDITLVSRLRACPFPLCTRSTTLRTQSAAFAIDYLRFTIDYLISSLCPRCPLWLYKFFNIFHFFT